MPHHSKFQLCQLVHVHLEKNHSSCSTETKKVAERRPHNGGYVKENPSENDTDDEKDWKYNLYEKDWQNVDCLV